MKKKNLLLMSLVALSALASCMRKNNGGDAKTIEIYAWEAGLGKVFLEDIVAAFNASQSEYKAVLETNTNSTTIYRTLDLGTSNNYDLYFTILNSRQYNKDFEPMNDLLNETLPGDKVTLKEKFYPGYVSSWEEPDGTIRNLGFGNTFLGIIYQRSLVSEDQLPRTTNELESLVADLQGQGTYPWLFFNQMGPDNGYWDYITETWAAQYNGLDYMKNNLMQLKDKDGNSPSKEVFKAKDGRYEALKVMESILTDKTTHPQCTNQNFTTVQDLYLDGQAAMTVNGSWLLNENHSQADVAMMKTPVISSIVKTLENTSMDDNTLSQIVAAVDEGKDSSSLCSAKDFARIKEARNIFYNNSSQMYVFIPKYSNAVEGSKEFLRFYYSDKGAAIYENDLHLPSNVRLTDPTLYHGENGSNWSKTLFTLANDANYYMRPMYCAKPFTEHGINDLANVVTAQAMIVSNAADRKNADQIWDGLEAKVDENWEDWIE